MIEFGKGTNLLNLEIEDIYFSDIAYLEPTFVNPKPPFL